MPACPPAALPVAPATPPGPRIGIFDSGIGGLSVLRAVQQRLPQALCHYIADSRFTPWGERSAGWVVARCMLLSAYLLDQGNELVLVACNTATTQAITALRRRWPGQQFVGIEPGIKPGAAASRNGRIAVLATPGTMRSARLAHLVLAHARQVSVLRLPCPGLAEAIEAAGDDEPRLAGQLDAISATLRQTGVDTVVLGCTHYPLVADALAQRLGPGVLLVDTADAVARRVASLLSPGAALAETGLGTAPGPAARPPLLQSTGPTAALHQAARRWLGQHLAVRLLVLPDHQRSPAQAQPHKPRAPKPPKPRP